MTHHSSPSTHHLSLITVVLALLAVLLSSMLLWLVLGTYGARLLTGDSFVYVRTALALAQGHGTSVAGYDVAADRLRFDPTTHYPPLTSLFYAMAFRAGIAPAGVPALVALAGWLLLLAGIGVLTWRLGRSLALAALAVVLATCTYSYWYIFQYALSEPIFLPLLVWCMALLVDTAALKHPWWRLLVAAMLLALLMLTRYVGFVVWGAAGLWWLWAWLQQQQQQQTLRRGVRRLLAGWAILALAALPAGAWMLANALRTDAAVGHHTQGAGVVALNAGLVALLIQSVQVVVPSLYLTDWLYSAGKPALAAILLCWCGVLLLVWRLWRRQPAPPPGARGMPPLRSPLMLFVLLYVLLYTAARPFFSFWPLDTRDVTTLLVLVQPLLLGTLGRVAAQHPAARRTVLLAAGGWVGMVALLAFAPLALRGAPPWLHLAPPAVAIDAVDISERSEVGFLPQGGDYGLLSWIAVHRPPLFAHDLAREHPDLAAWLSARRGEPPVLITNEPMLLVMSDARAVEHIRESYSTSGRDLPAWASYPRCESRYAGVLLVVVDWDYLQRNAASYRRAIEQQCPSLRRHTFRHSVVYEVRQRHAVYHPMMPRHRIGGRVIGQVGVAAASVR